MNFELGGSRRRVRWRWRQGSRLHLPPTPSQGRTGYLPPQNNSPAPVPAVECSTIGSTPERWRHLSEIFKKFGSDKELNYSNFYENSLRNIRQSTFNLLEIGVKNNSSLKAWKEFFPLANIYGIDINPKCKEYEEERINILICDQVDKNKILETYKNITFQVIIDDGSHLAQDLVETFNFLFIDKLEKGGFYFIEDLGMIYHDSFLNRKQKENDYFNLIRKIDSFLDLDTFSELIPDSELSESNIKRKYDKDNNRNNNRIKLKYGSIKNYVDYYIRKSCIILIKKKLFLDKHVFPLEN